MVIKDLHENECFENAILDRLKVILERHAQQNKSIEISVLLEQLEERSKSIDNYIKDDVEDKVFYYIKKLKDNGFLNFIGYNEDHSVLRYCIE